LADRSPLVLAAGIRTPLARSGGAFAKEDAGHLGALVARELIARTNIDPGTLDEVITGIAGPQHDQANVSRVIALRADVPEHVPARTVARNCASGMEAVACAMTSIKAGEAGLVLALGVEVMSRYPLIFSDQATAVFEQLSRSKSAGAKLATLARFRPAMFAPRIALLEGLTDPIPGLIMGKTAEILAREFAISRAEADRYALESHLRARSAREVGRFAREILPVLPLGTKAGAAALEHDDSIREGQTIEALAKLRPVFEKPDGRVTVGNSCGITDGAVALLVTTEDRAEKLGITPLARLVSFAWAGLDPARMGLGPVYSSAKALDKAGLTLEDMDVIELNEAFAAQVLACMRASESDEFGREKLGRKRALGKIDAAKLNPNGGAIALGHPVGATGARLLLTAAHELALKKARYALATLCIGGGQGGAFVLERIGA